MYLGSKCGKIQLDLYKKALRQRWRTPTPCELRTHTAEPVPFLIYYPGIEPDCVQTFDEVACVEGSYGILKEDEFMNEFMKK